MIRLVVAMAGALALALALEARFFPLDGAVLHEKVLFYVLLNANVMALTGLGFFIVRSLVGLRREWRERVLGYRFKTRLAATFLLLTAAPLGILFLVSSGLGTNYIEKFFTPQFRESMDSAVELARTYYENERQRSMDMALEIRKGASPPPGYSVERLGALPVNPSPSIASAFGGEQASEVVSLPDGDIIRAALPISPQRPAAGVLVVESTVPRDMSQNLGRILASYENFLSLESWKTPLKMNYLMVLGFFTTTIIFSALWAGLKIAGWITEPVKNLAAATKEVAAGNLDVFVRSSRRDEMGLLVESFNTMVREMRADKDSLRKAYLNLENIVKNINSGVISIDERGFVRAINEAACGILGIGARDVLGRFHTELLANITSKELSALIKGIDLRHFRSLEREMRVSLSGRSAPVTLRVSISGLRGQGGEHLGLLVVVDDLTEFVKAQRAMAWQEVARRMAHEIKNPLTPIQLSTERMLKKWQSGDPEFGRIFERSTRTIIKEVDGLKRLCNEFSRMGKLPEMAKAPADIVEIVSEARNLYKGYKDLSIGLQVDAEPAPPPLLDLDREQIRRALINVIDNAREAMGDEGAIAVRVSYDAPEGRVKVSISDTGPGIDADDMERLFEPYFSTKKDGTGLGLAISDRIVAEHGGTIRVRANEPRGCVFTIELPVKEG